MTNAVERMMKEYGVEKAPIAKIKFPSDDAKYPVRFDYPPFTAEKQIELIKLISEEFDYITLGLQLDYFASKYNEDITNALARIVITSKPILDNAKVKEILQR